MPKMTPELQAAYNEWLLLWGYRWALVDEVRAIKPMLAYNTTFTEWKRCTRYDPIIYGYQLRTPEEIECQK